MAPVKKDNFDAADLCLVGGCRDDGRSH